jgi:beta-lactamase superfamily II metal-dependent hydrolase
MTYLEKLSGLTQLLTRPEDFSMTVFGPGYGESIVVHFGYGRWLVVDSCKVDRRGRPLPLLYLQSVGVDVGRDVQAVILSHWHDDHIRGAAELVEACSSASVCIPASFNNVSFRNFLGSHEDVMSGSHGTGVDEIKAVFRSIRSPRSATRRKPVLLSSNKEFLRVDPKCETEVRFSASALSPSDRQVVMSLESFERLTLNVGETKRRAPATGGNHDSVVLWLEFADSVLLGSDLEHHADADCGWESVVNSEIKRRGASVFKIAHHGSTNAHHDRVWAEMLEPKALAIVTPWNRGSGLPSKGDLERIQTFTENLFLTSEVKKSKQPKLDRQVEKALQHSGVTMLSVRRSSGAVTISKPMRSKGPWCVDVWDASALVA